MKKKDIVFLKKEKKWFIFRYWFNFEKCINKKIKHLDEREFFIESNKVTQPNEVKVINAEGMPVHKFPSQKGDLYITFNVKLHKSLNKKEKELIKEIFPE